jgi:hypothetical protein
MDVTFESKTMKPKYISLIVAVALLAAGGLWLSARWTTDRALHKSDTGSAQTPDGPQAGQPPRLAPPNPNRKFEKLTPEERVKLARRGPIGG